MSKGDSVLKRGQKIGNQRGKQKRVDEKQKRGTMHQHSGKNRKTTLNHVLAKILVKQSS